MRSTPAAFPNRSESRLDASGGRRKRFTPGLRVGSRRRQISRTRAIARAPYYPLAREPTPCLAFGNPIKKGEVRAFEVAAKARNRRPPKGEVRVWRTRGLLSSASWRAMTDGDASTNEWERRMEEEIKRMRRRTAKVGKQNLKARSKIKTTQVWNFEEPSAFHFAHVRNFHEKMGTPKADRKFDFSNTSYTSGRNITYEQIVSRPEEQKIGFIRYQ